ncbi:MAG: hypothetical protein M1832_005419 [Thelocarpon impressellum]|nr:MAG: hypothetical protein M1832_005419 [Thelocarpon impressellum]
MLDENLPIFFIKPSPGNNPLQSTLYLSHHGSELEPAYTLRRPDPALHSSKNGYSVALFDSYNPDVLYAEVLVRPEWTQPTLSAAEQRRGETVPPPPQPIIPTDFVIQLYEPDQQVHVKQKPGSWGGSPFWEFELPQQTFRQPSTSRLDRSRDDPAASVTTPMLTFRWKKDGKLSKDLVCTLTSKSGKSDRGRRKNGGREPDITVALFQRLKDVTIYEPNLSRVDLEDPKGLEVVLLLSAAAIRDVFFGNIREVFNITQRPVTLATGESSGKSNSAPSIPALGAVLRPLQPDPPINGRSVSGNTILSSGPPPQAPRSQSIPGARPEAAGSRPPRADALTQWQIDAETTRLKAEAEAERRAAEQAERKERKRIKKMLEDEERERRRRQAEVDRETERLKRVFRDEQRAAEQMSKRPPQQPQQPPRPPQSSSTRLVPLQPQNPYVRPQSVPPPRTHTPVHPSRAHAQPRVTFAPGPSGGIVRPDDGRRTKPKPKRSIFGLRDHGDEGRRVARKKSSLF